MDVKYINPFVDAVRTVLATMLQMDVTFGKPHVTDTVPRYDVSGIIGMSGDVAGSIVLSFPTPVALVVIQKFAGSEFPVSSPDFSDALGELANMISGAAKAKFEGKDVSISVPSVVIGAGHSVARPKDTICISLPCKVHCGEFSIDIAIREKSSQRKAA